ncbi:alpha/beta hydrolase [Tumebacillus permanentifrigoris]|uniref:Esterase/lipase n=1 Tax=Tumebacillus permanentifrigoris TaxID=378543 RepID=A0A316D9A0_9BACL|nr:alpha/beta fold hydrolase [Tumebacillus permanentifrigoris]PWK13090.1 esterase/lipase [Tumebacillus permanentifrigoris]
MGVCLLIHGFTGAPTDLGQLAERLRAAGHEVHTPTLAGHGATRLELERVSWLDWIHSAEKELVKLLQQHQQVHVVGFSMGGLIATYLSNKYRDRICSLSLLSTPIYTINPKQLFRTITEAIQKSMRNHPSSPRSDEDVQRYLAKVKSTPMRSLVHFRRLVQTAKPLMEEIEMPLLVLQGELDDLVEARSATYIYESARSGVKNLQLYPQSRHMICVDCEAEQVMQEVVQFIRAQEAN